jgi:uncharacterized protein with von Willebrand factor type A (vWA) domain
LKNKKERHEGGSNGLAPAAPRPLVQMVSTRKAAFVIGKFQQSAVKVWDQRLSDRSTELWAPATSAGAAVASLHAWAATLDLDDTIHSTAANAGHR